MDKGRLTYSNTIENCYVIKTSHIDNLKHCVPGQMKTNQNKMKEPPKNQISCAEEKVQEIQSGRYSKEKVPQLINILTLHKISVFEVTASNVKGIVQEQLCNYHL